MTPCLPLSLTHTHLYTHVGSLSNNNNYISKRDTEKQAKIQTGLISTRAVQTHTAAPPPNVADTTNCYTELHNWTSPVPHEHTLSHTLTCTLLSLHITEVFLSFFKKLNHTRQHLQIHFLVMHRSFRHAGRLGLSHAALNAKCSGAAWRSSVTSLHKNLFLCQYLTALHYEGFLFLR